ncbi:DUF4846 domain-containing protein [Spongiimicrobium salis]|uniref:DUF4846 domain-containing protein n=1 Tax=Spongiimicrobium salis TaxID=1667022 RepID=UPI00374D587F
MKSALLLTLVFVSMFLKACGQGNSSPKEKKAPLEHTRATIPQIDTTGTTILTRFSPPKGFYRTGVDSLSFAQYLRSLPLKAYGAKVHYYNGNIKENYAVYDAVVDLPIGTRDLHQCADAVMRLRAEYLYQQKNYEAIHFNFTNGFRVNYTEWAKGKRIAVNGNSVRWIQKTAPSHTYKEFWNYMEIIFSYAGTASLSKEMIPIPSEQLDIGDVFIQGGFPGHAVIVVDVAIHQDTQEKIFLLAQSYMPAQETQILKNPNNPDLSPWYSIKEGSQVKTPEWIFQKTDLKRFKAN